MHIVPRTNLAIIQTSVKLKELDLRVLSSVQSKMTSHLFPQESRELCHRAKGHAQVEHTSSMVASLWLMYNKGIQKTLVISKGTL